MFFHVESVGTIHFDLNTEIEELIAFSNFRGHGKPINMATNQGQCSYFVHLELQMISKRRKERYGSSERCRLDTGWCMAYNTGYMAPLWRGGHRKKGRVYMYVKGNI